jgi:hypothetical protein
LLFSRRAQIENVKRLKAAQTAKSKESAAKMAAKMADAFGNGR